MLDYVLEQLFTCCITSFIHINIFHIIDIELLSIPMIGFRIIRIMCLSYLIYFNVLE